MVFQRDFVKAITTGNLFLTFCIKILHYISGQTYVLFLGFAQTNRMTFWPNQGAVYVKELETCAR
jgi:hypothetical protein